MANPSDRSTPPPPTLGVAMDDAAWGDGSREAPGAAKPAALTVRQQAAAILREAGWDLPPCPIAWSPRLSRCAGVFVVEKDRRGIWHPEIRLSIPLLRRRDWAWPVQVVGCNCRTPEDVVRRILEHELIHYKLWKEGVDWGHTERFRDLAWSAFGHQSITHGIGVED